MLTKSGFAQLIIAQFSYPKQACRWRNEVSVEVSRALAMQNDEIKFHNLWISKRNFPDISHGKTYTDFPCLHEREMHLHHADPCPCFSPAEMVLRCFTVIRFEDWRMWQPLLLIKPQLVLNKTVWPSSVHREDLFNSQKCTQMNACHYSVGWCSRTEIMWNKK